MRDSEGWEREREEAQSEVCTRDPFEEMKRDRERDGPEEVVVAPQDAVAVVKLHGAEDGSTVHTRSAGGRNGRDDTWRYNQYECVFSPAACWCFGNTVFTLRANKATSIFPSLVHFLFCSFGFSR